MVDKIIKIVLNGFFHKYPSMSNSPQLSLVELRLLFVKAEV